MGQIFIGLVGRNGQSLVSRFFVGANHGRIGQDMSHLRRLLEVSHKLVLKLNDEYFDKNNFKCFFLGFGQLFMVIWHQVTFSSSGK